MQPSVPEVVDFCRRLAPTAPQHKALRELHAALSAIDPGASLEDREQQLERLVTWIRDPAPPPGEHPASVQRMQHLRLAMVLDVLDQVAPWRDSVARVLSAIVAEAQAVHLIAEVGVPSDRGFLDETMDRLAQKFLPSVRDTHDLADLFAHYFPGQRDVDWLATLPVELSARVRALLPSTGVQSWAPLWQGVADAARLLATRVCALGLSEEIRSRATHGQLSSSPFFLLPRVVEALLTRGPSPVSSDKVTGHADVEAVADLCRAELAVVHANLENTGISVDVVYRMDVMGYCLMRLGRLTPLLSAVPDPDPQARDRLVTTLVSRLVAAGLNDLSFRQLVRKNMGVLARKIIERVGGSGEHYITGSRREWWKMIRSAGGGGVLTAGTAALKYLIGWAKLPLFVAGFVNSMNYAVGFVVMQLVGFTLATKQPSMTAAALAQALRSSNAVARLEELGTMIARMVRSQLAAAMGNVLLVIPAAIGLDALVKLRTGKHFLDADTAHHVLESLHPFRSPVIWFAFLTGIYLWLSSLVAGWLENFMVYRRVPEAIAQHRLGRVLGRPRMQRISRWFSKNINGLGGSVSLGFFLGFAPVLGTGFGLPIGAAHITLSTGGLTLAVCAMGPEIMTHGAFIGAAIGIVIIGLLNFGVSFALALLVALRARNVENKERLSLGAYMFRRFLKRPGEFFYPPKGSADIQSDHDHEPAKRHHTTH